MKFVAVALLSPVAASARAEAKDDVLTLTDGYALITPWRDPADGRLWVYYSKGQGRDGRAIQTRRWNRNWSSTRYPRISRRRSSCGPRNGSISAVPGAP